MGLHADVVAPRSAAVVEHPFRERFREQLRLALYRCGRQVERWRCSAVVAGAGSAGARSGDPAAEAGLRWRPATSVDGRAAITLRSVFTGFEATLPRP